jgi:dihydroflavonol-4-reductase
LKLLRARGVHFGNEPSTAEAPTPTHHLHPGGSIVKIAVTGASGFLGGNLAVCLAAQGHDVRCTYRGRPPSHLAEHHLAWSCADITDGDALLEAFPGVEVVFHCAAAMDMRARTTPHAIRVNVDGTRNVVQACARAGVSRLVHCSSAVTIGLSEDGAPVDEGAIWNLERHRVADSYAVTKRRGEELVLAQREVDAVVVNPTYLLGPLDPKPSSGRLLVDFANGRLPGFPVGSNNFVDVRDVCRGMQQALERGRAGERYILGGENLPYSELFARAAVQAGLEPLRRPLPRAAGLAVALMGELQELFTQREAPVNLVKLRWGSLPSFQLSSAKAEHELGYRHGPIDAALRDAFAFFRARGMIHSASASAG